MGTKRHCVVLLDIDETLVIFKDYRVGDAIQWTGGRDCWYKNLVELKLAAELEDVIIHYGIATYKWRYYNSENKNSDKRGDYISGIVTSDPKWLNTPELKQHPGISDLLEPELIFFLGYYYQALENNIDKNNLYRIKIDYALEPARKFIENKFKTFVSKRDSWLLDDQLYIVANTQIEHNACWLRELKQYNLEAQQEFINEAFKKILTTIQNQNKANKSKTPYISATELMQTLGLFETKPQKKVSWYQHQSWNNPEHKQFKP